MKALVVNALGRGFEVEDVEIARPRGREVLVEVQASWLCHTDLLFATHDIAPTPAVLGHEVARSWLHAIIDTLGDLVGDSDVLLSSLANDEAVRATYLGENGIFANVQSGTTILEMSTISPDLSAILHREARKCGAEMMDLPVSGSTPAVNAGTVTLFAGGEPETFNRCIPIFESIARQWYLMG